METLEESGSVYYYSTRSDGQTVNLVHGVRLTGSMDVPQIMSCCREQGIRLLIDAAHPFAEELHHNLLLVASQLLIPIIRYDRIYPPHTDDVTWCNNYEEAVNRLEADGIERLLALTGVNTISRLRNYWQKHECWFRILHRCESKTLAQESQFPEDHLVYYEHDDTTALIERLKPDAILSKESGLSGGFNEKVEAARRAGVPIYVVNRPQDSCRYMSNVQCSMCNGPHGLRRAVEHLLPEFFPLHSGLTTGTCATAAAVAILWRKLSGETPSEVSVELPDGETINVPVSYGNDYASCFKEAGDDPDVTNGMEIRAEVSLDHSPSTVQRIDIRGGKGVGRFTLPGFDYPPGEAAINKGPRKMIRHNLQLVLNRYRSTFLASNVQSLTVTISVPQGEEVAKRTFNPRLGIEGGISIIGVSGIVKPFSEEAFIDSIRKCLEVAKASGTNRVVLNSGGKSERVVRSLYPTLPQQAFVQYGNYIDAALRKADELKISNITLCVMLGKAVKLANGHLDTHSRRAVMNKPFIADMMHEAGCTEASIEAFLAPEVTLARDLWNIIPAETQQAFCSVVIDHCYDYCRPLLPNGDLTILLVGEDDTIHYSSSIKPATHK